MGRNGAGKTTTMRITLGLARAGAGAVRWQDRPVTAEDRRGFGHMPEDRGLYPKMTAPAGQLLAGKVIGIGVVGLIQLVAFVILGLITASVTGSIDLPPETMSVAGQVILWFVLGFALYSCLFAVGGALAIRAEELQSTTTPLTFLAVASLFAAMNAGGNPSGRIAEVATFIPFSAPMVLPIRIAAGEVSVPAVLLAVAIVLVSIVAAMSLAARVYTGGGLHSRGQLPLRSALRSG